MRCSAELWHISTAFQFKYTETVINLERDYIAIVSNEEKKANDILFKLFNNLVSPIHLIDVVGEYSDLCVAEL